MVIGFIVLGIFADVASVGISVETDCVSLAAVVTGTSVVTSAITSTAATVVSAFAARGVVDVSVVATTGEAILSGVVFLVTDSVDTSVLTTVVTVEASVVTSVSTKTFICAVVVSVGADVVTFVVSTTCFSAVALAVVASSISVVILSVASVFCTGETVLSVSFPVIAPVEVISKRVAIVGLELLGIPKFVMTSFEASIETASFSLEAVITGAAVVFAVVTSTPAAFKSASVAIVVLDTSVFSTPGTAVVKGIVVSVTDTLVLPSVFTVEAGVVTSVSKITCAGSVFFVSAGAVVGGFVFSTTCFSAFSRTVLMSPTSVVIFSVVSLVFTGETVPSVTAAMEVSSARVPVVGLVLLRSFTLILISVIGFVETVSDSLAGVVTGASVVT